MSGVPKILTGDRLIREPVLQELLFSLSNEDRQTSELRAVNLVGQKVRGLEIWWRSDEGQVRCYLVSEKDDVSQFKKSFELYGSSSVADFVDFSAPPWLPDIDPAATVFFMFQTQNGHIVSWNLKSERTFLRNLISQILHTKYAWTQILWCKYDASRYLGKLASVIRTEIAQIPKELEKERVYRDENGRLKRERYTTPNKEYFRDFRTYGNRIAQHLSLKSSSGDVLVMVRGLLCPQVQIESDITDVDTTLPLLTTSVESGGAGGPIGERLIAIYSNDPRHLIDLMMRRIPDPDKMLRDWVNEYLSPYRASPPFILMTPQELSLLVHAPDVSGLPLQTTRQSAPMGSLTKKEREGPELWS